MCNKGSVKYIFPPKHQPLKHLWLYIILNIAALKWLSSVTAEFLNYDILLNAYECLPSSLTWTEAKMQSMYIYEDK